MNWSTFQGCAIALTALFAIFAVCWSIGEQRTQEMCARHPDWCIVMPECCK